ncbi:hypothetical protein ACQRIU_004368 [Beauveria bassiana]
MASDEVNVRWRSLMALDLPPAPANLRRNHYTIKAQVMKDLAKRYNELSDSEESKFGAYQLALFSIASSATIEAVQNDDEKLQDIGGSAKDLVKFFVNGSYILEVAKTADPSGQPSGQGDNLTVEGGTAVEPMASSLVTRAIGSVRQFAHHRKSSSREPPEQPAASSEPAPDPQSSIGRVVRSLKRKTSHRSATQSTVPDTVSSVVNKPKPVRPRRSPPTARNPGIVQLVKDRDSHMCILTKNGRIEMQVVSQPLQFAMDPDNLISEVGESETIDRTVGKLAHPSELRESETAQESVAELERLLKLTTI